ncbi:hypothetical protein C7999DRAFT_11801 [Corynascus novoguineensis]|uniref:Diphthine--ammonia ligase n=1 Tax=Corynascus novoguineensis TaxID=1126955 RepID=A0AAN7CYJ9_9PEZI|nr:hypothetical protein C7999DRAFT_11801 [Corynascus novoguineensis]
MASTQPNGLNVIALVSGGKDSFFSLLHCRANGHRIVALANLHPVLPRQQGSYDGTSQCPIATTHHPNTPAGQAASAASSPVLESTHDGRPHQALGKDGRHPAVLPGRQGGGAGNERLPEADEDERDLNSFMYQTVGHQVIPLYAEATGIPLYRREITGGAVQHGKDYSHYRSSTASAARASPGLAGGPVRDPDETESMVPLLQAIKKAHPEANAICAGAILSTYQRTRVESVAIRLGLTPVAYLWKFPVLPTVGPSSSVVGTDAQLLDDMAAAGVEARIIKVASGGLDDSFLWTNVASPAGKAKLARAMRRFGAAAETGAVIGEGGEFETLVLDGPSTLFKKRIVVAQENRHVVREGGGNAWLSLRNARLEAKATNEDSGDIIRIPELLDPSFASLRNALVRDDGTLPPPSPPPHGSLASGVETEAFPQLGTLQRPDKEMLQQWSFSSGNSASKSIEAETQRIVEQIRQRLRQQSLPASAILSATVVLRRMADFPVINGVYGTLFDAPNPPSRVTISCGCAAEAGIAVYLTVHIGPLQPSQRHGLHVQSRSYWAPANIGPYSQAISVPVSSFKAPMGRDSDGVSSSSSSSSPSGPRLVSIAGQIPLVPATMAFPYGGDSNSNSNREGDALPLELALSLQHLWRIGLEMGVQWWTSAVAYLPVSSSSPSSFLSSDEKRDMRAPRSQVAEIARMIGKAWDIAHTPTGKDDEEEDDDDEEGPDLWDRRYNPQYMTYTSTGSEEGKTGPVLPDRCVLAPSSRSRRPPAFVAEVDELPRGADVEWHAHLGIAQAEEGSVALRETIAVQGPEGIRVAQTIVVGPRGLREGKVTGVGFVQTAVAEGFGGCGYGEHGKIAKTALAQLGEVSPAGEPVAVVRYVDVEVLRERGKRGAAHECREPVVPCKSLWNGEGERLAALSIYHSVFEREG